MADTEEYFPRGGKKPAIKEFNQTSNFLGTVAKGEKKKKRIKKKPEGDDGYLSDEVDAEFEQSTKNCAVGLSYQTVKEGLVILGRVVQVQETKIYMSLPCRMKGTVMACHVSEPYTKLLEAYVADEVESIRELRKMFRPGQYVAVKVLEVEKEKENLLLSMMPQHVNSGKIHSDLQKGALIQAAVTSVEDHGYVMDLGIENARAFLPKKNASEDVELDAGVVTWCTIKSVTSTPDNSIITLTNHLASLQQPVKRKPSKGLSVVTPGAAVEFTVDKALENGIEGHIFDGITSYIQRQHADKVKGKKPTLGQRIRAHLLYEMPTRKHPFLTLKSVFETAYPDLDQEQRLKTGDIVEDAQVIKISRRSVVMRLADAGVGILSLKRLQLSEDLTDEQVLAKSYPIGSTHRVRVLCYNLSDYAYSVSDNVQVLSAKHFTLRNLAVGQVVDATVSAVNDANVVLKLDRLTGVVPHSHLTDSGVYIDSKKPTAKKPHKKKYKVGQQVSARVLHVDPDSEALILTLKPSLLAPDLEVLQSYEDAKPGKAYTGVIKYTSSEYILVSFFSHVTAYVPRGHVTKEPLDNLADAFHPGQVVCCTIIKVDPANKKMLGSLTVKPFTPKEKSDQPHKRKQTDNIEVPKKKLKQSDNEIDNAKHDKKKKDKKSKAEATSNVEETDTSKKKKARKQSETDNSEVDETLKESKEIKHTNKSKKKKKKNLSESETDHGLLEKDTNDRSKRKKVPSISETDEDELKTSESDAIDTDLPDDDQILTPKDMILIDMTDCVTRKNYKKRVVSLLKAIQSRTDRLVTVEQKIKAIENKGLSVKNKKYHTAMQAEKLIVQERIKKLFEALQIAQDKLKEFPEDEIKDWKKKKTPKEKKNTEDGEEKPAKESPKEKVKKAKKGKVTKGETELSVKDDVVKVADVTTPVLDVPSVKDFWSANTEVAQVEKEEESSSSDEEQQEQPKKKRKKLTAAEKVAKAREEEERLREMERVAIEGATRPQSVEQFERALLANPDSSQLWIAYMAFHLQATEIEKARAVGRKALTTISFREEQEKLNVWLAMLNFENRFGTKESQQKTLEEALQMNDTYKIHSKLLDVYAETSKVQELTSLVDLMMRKYKRDPQTFIICGQTCYKMALIDKARQVMQKAVAVLDKKEHVTVLVQFALMERAAGERERAEALFEQVLGVYPQRVDVCSTYVDMLLKSGDLEQARQVMERMTSQKLPARKMKILYKKWIEVEEKVGDKDQAERIRQKALEFIEKAKF